MLNQNSSSPHQHQMVLTHSHLNIQFRWVILALSWKRYLILWSRQLNEPSEVPLPSPTASSALCSLVLLLLVLFDFLSQILQVSDKNMCKLCKFDSLKSDGLSLLFLLCFPSFQVSQANNSSELDQVKSNDKGSWIFMPPFGYGSCLKE